jgi:gamma-glutamylcyclotransferase (GGCT)/AIG2-like uncharacterized protein YtfP
MLLMDRLFVYGTLRPGARNEQAAWLAGSARHLGTGRIRGRLYRLAYYPALGSPLAEDDWVSGDLFAGVTAEMLHRLDQYEGSEYARELTDVTTPAGHIFPAYFYRFLMPVDALKWIPSGDWKTATPSSFAPE